MKASKLLLYFSILMTVVIITGCLNYEERIILNKDGSGEMEVHYYAERNVKINDYGFLSEDEEEIRREVERKYTSSRVKLTHFDIRDKNSKRHVYFTVNFKNVEDLNDLDLFADSRIKMEKKGRRLSLQRYLEISKDDDWDESDSFIEEAIKSTVEDMVLDKIKFRFEWIMPGKIEKSNADYEHGSNRAVWRFRLSDVMGRETVEMYARSRR